LDGFSSIIFVRIYMYIIVHRVLGMVCLFHHFYQSHHIVSHFDG